MFAPDPLFMLSDEKKTKLRKLAWSAFSKFVLASAGAVGAKLGEGLVQAILDDGDEEEEPEPPEDPERPTE